MLKKIATTCLMVFATFSYAQTTGEIFDLSGSYIRIGVSDFGTIGSKGNDSPGILYDNTGTGTFNTAYDYLTPGAPFEGFTVKYTGASGAVSETNNNMGGGPITGTLYNYSGLAYGGTTFDQRAVWIGTGTGYGITNDVRFNNNQKFVDISTKIAATTNMTDLYFARFTDPDARAAAGDSSATTNTLGYSPIPATNVVFSEALVSKYALGLYSAATNVGAGISSGWSTDPITYYSGTNDGNGDYTIGLGFYVPTLNTGDEAVFQYAYIFGPSTLDAGATAVSSGAGGGTAGVVPGCVTDCEMPGVTPPAPSEPTPPPPPPAPTVVSSTTDTLVGSLTVYNRGIQPKVLNIRKTHNTSSTPITTDTYSDGSEVVTVGETSTTESVDNFGTRIDQFDKLGTINNTINYSLDSDVLTRNSINDSRFNKEDKTNVYLIGGGNWSNKFDGYKYSGNTYGIGSDFQVTPDLIVGAQYSRTDIRMTGENAGGNLTKDHFGLYSAYLVEDFVVKSDLAVATNNYRTNHSLPELGLSNTGSAKGTDMWFSTRVYTPSMSGFRPFAGVRVESNKRDAVTERGDSLTAMSYDAKNKTNTSADVGLRYESELDKDWKVLGEYVYNTQNINSAYVGVGYQPTNNSVIRAKVGQTRQNGIESNAAQLEARIYF